MSQGEGEREGCYFVGSAEGERGFRAVCALRKDLADAARTNNEGPLC